MSLSFIISLHHEKTSVFPCGVVWINLIEEINWKWFFKYLSDPLLFHPKTVKNVITLKANFLQRISVLFSIEHIPLKRWQCSEERNKTSDVDKWGHIDESHIIQKELKKLHKWQYNEDLRQTADSVSWYDVHSYLNKTINRCLIISYFIQIKVLIMCNNK